MPIRSGLTAAVIALCTGLSTSAGAADAAAPDLKTEIDGVIHRVESATQGMIKWDGAERMDVHADGDASVADIMNARILIERPKAQPPEPAAHVVLDRIEVRRTPRPDGSFDLSIGLPKEAVLHAADDEEVRFTIKDATSHMILDAQSERAIEINLGFANARIEDKKSGNWVSFGPLTGAFKLDGAKDGSWTAPSNFDLKSIEFFSAKGPIGGTIDRLGMTGRAAGPDLAAANRVRDRWSALQQQDLPAPARADAVLDLLPDLLSQYSLSKAEFTVDGLTVRQGTGAPLFTLAKASFGGALTGLSGDNAALRITVKNDGMAVGPSVPNGNRIPRQAVLDLGLEDVATAPLRTILAAVPKMREGASDAGKDRARQQMMGAVAALTPTLRLYDLDFETPGVGIDATAQAKGSPLSPKGYTAGGEAKVRGFDQLGDLFGEGPATAYLPLLKELGEPEKASDGSPSQVVFHLASAPPKWITLNGQDISAWFIAGHAVPGEPRELKPAKPPMTGGDVNAVQHALAGAKIEVPDNGIYDGATSVAVARFQQQSGLNENGVVDAATRQKLGIKPEPGVAPAPK
jgi:hypothetical protein